MQPPLPYLKTAAAGSFSLLNAQHPATLLVKGNIAHILACVLHKPEPSDHFQEWLGAFRLPRGASFPTSESSFRAEGTEQMGLTGVLFRSGKRKSE
jgi:hypothetical protein